MLERNLGNIERVIRLVFGLGLLFWAYTQTTMNAIDWFVVIISVMLVLNGIFSRCFIWWILGLNTFKPATTEANCD
ncbi:YgaP family membrane protein [Oceanicoccus sagamiensis]|uniref:Inner membrane protein YgaP-like transmembrane domain-containing protein n=1 Tax=Oceanicoccus sagamiensis TaxID=716816 RepID=A0A1X9NFT7_9GAMM|nr:DUF2892 domain-containing protein [Oceanicoccus sagamiensis]ARN74369.1 hypothetical protein BST96_09690 [Oceanicoccus sagamiensis]